MWWQWEIDLIHWIWENLHGSSFWNGFNRILTWIGDGIQVTVVLSIAVIIMLFFKKTRKLGLSLGLGVLIFNLIGNNILIKNIVARPRPIYVDDTLMAYATDYFQAYSYAYIPKETSYAFMSGHTVAQFTIAFIVAFNHKKLAAPLLIWATLVASTRLFFGFHYPTDILYGILYAFISALITFAAANAIEEVILNRRKRRKIAKEN